MKKRCSICKRNLPLGDFNRSSRRKDGRQSHCRKCNSERAKAYYRRNRKHHLKVVKEGNARRKRENQRRLLELLSHESCSDCGEQDPVVLDFDHVRGRKIKAVSKMVVDGNSWDTILKEIAKCEVRCANCHRRKTAKQFGWYRSGSVA